MEPREVFYTPSGRCSLGGFVHRKQRPCTLNSCEKPVDCVAAQSYYWGNGSGNTLCGNRKWENIPKTIDRPTFRSCTASAVRSGILGPNDFHIFPRVERKHSEQLNSIPTNKRSIRGFHLSGTKCRGRGGAFRSRHTRGGIRRLWKMYNGPCMVLFIKFYINMCFP